MLRTERNKILNALWPAVIFVAILAGIHLFQAEVLGNEAAATYRDRLPLNKYGMQPRKIQGLKGIITMHFLHGSWNHLYNNAIALLFLGWTMVYFYRTLVIRTVLAIMILGGAWLWLAGEEGSTHIGASGLVYGLVTFLFFSGVLRRYTPLIAISMLIVFLYGSLIWGVFPFKDNISWEGHLWGGVSGVVMAFYYKFAGPQRPKYRWEVEDDPADDAVDAPWKQIPISPTTLIENEDPPPSSSPKPPAPGAMDDEPRVVYHFKRSPKKQKPTAKDPDSD